MDSSSNNNIISNISINSNSSIEDASRARHTTSARHIHTRASHTRVWENFNYILMDNTCFSPSNAPEECGLTDIENGKNEEPYFFFNKVRSNNIDRPIIAHLNINFLSQKFEPLKDIVKNRVDILAISEIKLYNSFPMGEFEIEGYSTPIRLGRNCHGGGIFLYVRSDLPCK